LEAAFRSLPKVFAGSGAPAMKTNRKKARPKGLRLRWRYFIFLRFTFGINLWGGYGITRQDGDGENWYLLEGR
jgi:hypothetical protein